MSSSNSKSNSSWSKWTWTPEHSCDTRFRTNGSEWQFKNEKGRVKTTFVRNTGSVNSNWEDRSTSQSQPKSAVIDDEEIQDDYARVQTTSRRLSNMGQQGPLPQEWARPSSDQRQDDMGSVSFATPSATENFAGSPYGASQLSLQQTQYSESKWANLRSGSIGPQQRGTTFDNDKNFRTYESKKFRFGKVFKIKWSEPNGANGTQITVRAAHTKAKDQFVKMRRFVIVKTFPGHSLCLPILTYSGQGTTKKGVHASDHAIIYTDPKRGPRLVKGEELTKAALRMEAENESHKLDSASRVNYAKVYTVEHNVPVQFIGVLTRNAQAQLSADYNRQHPPIEEIEPEPGYVVQGVSAQSDSFNANQEGQAAEDPTSKFYYAPTVESSISEYRVPASLEASTSREASLIGSEQGLEYTTQNLPVAHSDHFQYAELNRALPDDIDQTPSIPRSESTFPISSVSIQQLDYRSTFKDHY